MFRNLAPEYCTKYTYEEQKLKPVDDGVDGEDRFPVFSEDVEADVAFLVDVGVVDQGVALDLRGFVRVVRSHLEAEHETPVSIHSLRNKKHRARGKQPLTSVASELGR